MIAPVWFWLTGIALLALGGLMLLGAHRSIEKRASALETSLAKNAEESRRAHVRLDNHQRQIEALGKELGWVDDKSFTRVLTGRLPRPSAALPPPPRLPTFETLPEDEEP